MVLVSGVRAAMLFLLVVTALSTAPDARAFHIRLYGLVTDHYTGEPVKGVQVRLVKDSVERETVVTAYNGRYEIYLERGYDYQVWFHRKDLVTKFVRIDARDIPLFPDVPFFEMDLQMTMIEWIEDFDFSVFDKPVGLAEYKHSVRNLNWDIGFTQARRQEIAKVMVRYERAIAQRKKDALEEARKKRRKPARF
jgi:5-hydroxyisourate hydrolase-like protein (transthyretin family)